jgi:hypothetical protein
MKLRADDEGECSEGIMSGTDVFGALFGNSAAAVLGLVFFRRTGALLRGRISAVIVGLVSVE